MCIPLPWTFFYMSVRFSISNDEILALVAKYAGCIVMTTIHMHMCTRTAHTWHTHTHIQHTHTHTAYTHIRTHTHTRTHAHTHTRTHAHAHTHTTCQVEVPSIVPGTVMLYFLFILGDHCAHHCMIVTCGNVVFIVLKLAEPKI